MTTRPAPVATMPDTANSALAAPFRLPAFPGGAETLAGCVRRLSRLPVITVSPAMLKTDFKAPQDKDHGKSGTDDGLTRITRGLAQGQFDLIAFGRALLTNADLANRLPNNDTAGLRPYRRQYLERLE